MNGPRCSSLLLSLAALLAPAACDAPGRAHKEGAPAASTAAAAGPATGAASPAASAASPPASPARVAVDARAMGTSLVLAAYTSAAMDEAAVRSRLEKAIGEIRRLEALMTTWRPDSELSRVNTSAGKGAVPVSPESLAVIEKSLWISERSGGVFDITFEAMHGLWKFDEDIDDNVPRRDDVERARALIDYRQIKIDRAQRTVMLGKPGMRMSLGGIAKGYAVDAAAGVLRAEGLSSFLVQAGGDLYIAGKKPDGSPWRAGIRDPRGKDTNDYFAMIEVEDHAFSTAGDYERSFIKEGRRYHHIIDPRTGFPASESRSVTIWAKDALTADAVDDAVFILGPEKGLELVESIDDCGAVIVDRNNKVWVSKRLGGKVEVLRQPTDGL
ncbi:FAD:protein FMN transferase [Sorangium sp. So ce131]|uniref:FAD:protein FMN transferase n=1 Tax=Sorangium sp. So ce131 TaxID=3133282 RepID=UPI003F62858A